jgi:hypothetical protein
MELYQVKSQDSFCSCQPNKEQLKIGLVQLWMPFHLDRKSAGNACFGTHFSLYNTSISDSFIN